MHECGSVRALLRRSTQAAHRRVDGLFADGFDGPAAYRAYLDGMHGFLASAAAAIDGLDDAVARLRADLDALGVAPAAAVPPASAATDAARLGWRYVIDGSSLGARVLLRQAQALGHSGESGARFLAAHAGGDAWRRTLEALDRFPDDPAARHDLGAGADAAFAAVHDALRRAFSLHRSALPA